VTHRSPGPSISGQSLVPDVKMGVCRKNFSYSPRPTGHWGLPVPLRAKKYSSRRLRCPMTTCARSALHMPPTPHPSSSAPAPRVHALMHTHMHTCTHAHMHTSIQARDVKTRGTGSVGPEAQGQ